MNTDVTKENEKIVMRISFWSMAVNVILSVFKLFAGIFAHSGAMISDAIHSASDVFSTIVVIIGYRLSAKESDENHPYGHERMECIAAMLLAGVLCFTGLAIGWSSLQKIMAGSEAVLEVPGRLAIVAAAVSILVKEGMFRVTERAAKQVNSGALMADAWHHRSDALSSVGSLVGVTAARLGYPICDPIAGGVICCFIVKASYDIFLDAAAKMMDTSCDTKTIEQMRDVILSQEGVLGIDRLRTRMFGARIYVDAEIAADGDLSLREAHAVAERVHDSIELNFQDVKHIMVHVNPWEGHDEAAQSSVAENLHHTAKQS